MNNATNTETDEQQAPEHGEAYKRVGPGYGTDPAILSAMRRLQRDIARAEESMRAWLAVEKSDWSGVCSGPQSGVGPALSDTRHKLTYAIKTQIEYLSSGEPERMAEMDAAS